MTAELDAIRERDADVPWTAVLGAPVTFREEYVWQALEDRHVLLAALAAYEDADKVADGHLGCSDPGGAYCRITTGLDHCMDGPAGA